MNREDRDRAARSNKITRAARDSRSGRTEQDAATKAVLDNMARLKALRLAREAATPPQPAAAKPARSKSSKRPGEKSPALAEWLASQQSGGRRT
ncbi:MAG TPA: hypothetical protein VJS63_04265 [Bradyrhizobium sp.]|nr:hypothetical protein [Bradyrhizobium sp.]